MRVFLILLWPDQKICTPMKVLKIFNDWLSVMRLVFCGIIHSWMVTNEQLLLH